jgi:predicted nucleic acid-binding protein
MNAVDTNVLVYAVDTEVPDKQSLAIEFLSSLAGVPSPVVLPWQVVVEFLACLRRWESLRRITRDQTSAYLAQVEATYEIILPTPGILTMSLDLLPATAFRIGTACWSRLVSRRA